MGNENSTPAAEQQEQPPQQQGAGAAPKRKPKKEKVRTLTEEASWMIAGDKLAAWVEGKITDNLLQIPGVGPENAELLRTAGFDTPLKLVGKFLSLREKDMSTQEHCDAFYSFLADDVGINASRAGITRAIGEKCNGIYPGIFDIRSLAQ